LRDEIIEPKRSQLKDHAQLLIKFGFDQVGIETWTNKSYKLAQMIRIESFEICGAREKMKLIFQTFSIVANKKVAFKNI